MKNLLLTCCFLAACITSLAQTSRGSFKIDGYVGYSYTNNKHEYSNIYGTSTSEITYTSLSFQPTVSYFVIKGLAVGGSINLSRNTTRYENTSDEEIVGSSITIGPSVGYYVGLTKSLFLVPQASIRWGRTNTDGYYLVGGDVLVPSETEGTTRRIDVGLGLTYFLNRHVGLDFLLNYAHTKTEYDYENNQWEILKNGGVSAGVGLSVFLSRGE